MNPVGIDLTHLGPYRAAVVGRLEEWHRADVGHRFWAKDPTLWPAAPATDVATRMGWIALLDPLGDAAGAFGAFADEVRAEGMRHAVVLGMGGSSLAPDLFARTFQPTPESLRLHVLDSTHPSAVAALAAAIDLPSTVFIVSSKSGTTIEPNSFYQFFREKVRAAGTPVGRHFVAITDPGTALETLAGTDGFRRVFSAPPDVGGRYSALTPFGLVPAALGGVNVGRLLGSADEIADLAGPSVGVADNPAFVLGAVLGELGRAGLDKITIVADPAFAAFPSWAEQLIAESTGKIGRGLVPVVDEPTVEAASYGADRLFVSLERSGTSLSAWLRDLVAVGHPVVRIFVDDPIALGGQFLLWEIAVAIAGSILGIDPYDQPDVELAKQLARTAMAGSGAAITEPPTVAASDAPGCVAAIGRWASESRPGDYLGIHAYLAPTPATTTVLATIRAKLLRQYRRATTFGYGPRFLHSTGQLYKGGPPTGRFLQFVDTPVDELPVPTTDYSFARLLRAQSVGDAQAMMQRGRSVLRVDLGGAVGPGLTAIAGGIGG